MEDFARSESNSLESQAQFIRSQVPDARFIVDFGLSVPVGWAKKYPGEMQTDEAGRVYREASWSSERYLEGLSKHISNLVEYCEGRPWSEQIIGYKVLPNCEGVLPLTLAGKMFDCSAQNERAFQEWVLKRYGETERLREAWGHPKVTFEQVRIPRDAEWLNRRVSSPPTLDGRNPWHQPFNGLIRPQGLFHWVESANTPQEQDYVRFMRENFLRWTRTTIRCIKKACAVRKRTRIVGMDVAKQPMMGWEIASSFDGVGDGHSYPNILFLSGSWNVGELLDDPNLDFIWTPADYTARTLGFALEAEGIADSLVLRGKLMLLEDDARSFVGGGVNDQGAFRNIKEVEAGLTRNAALSLSRGFQSYWCNVGTSGLSHCGVPYRIYLLKDLDVPSHIEA